MVYPSCVQKKDKIKAMDSSLLAFIITGRYIKSQCANKRKQARSSRDRVYVFARTLQTPPPTSRQITISSRLIQQPAGGSPGQGKLCICRRSRWARVLLSIHHACSLWGCLQSESISGFATNKRTPLMVVVRSSTLPLLRSSSFVFFCCCWSAK